MFVVFAQAMSAMNSAVDIDTQRISQAYLRDVVIEEEAMEEFRQIAAAQRASSSQVSEAMQHSLHSLQTEDDNNLADIIQASLYDAIPLYSGHYGGAAQVSRGMGASGSGMGASGSQISTNHCSGMTSEFKDAMHKKSSQREGKGKMSEKIQPEPSQNATTPPKTTRRKGNGVYING